ncbi:CIC11C00000002748 [Sungouiella intermedia]|uniref:CIC11C00000002748 n=1 Tax=Sungouiella intermedia TaxID=45354 RepID=A0A1L0G454_9ASCO|nr:CIC11C00000002748 [[Candida] intermedia]
MDSIASKYPYWKRVLHKFQSRRDIPFRKKFFVGYDLHGNTYWEFTVDGNMQRLRRKLEPYQEMIFKADYFDTIPPQWLQWLRRTRNEAPTLQELINDQIRQQRIKVLAQQADQRWYMEKERLENDQRLKLDAELKKVEAEKKKFEEESKILKELAAKKQNQVQTNPQADPWAEADAKAKSDHSPIESSFIKPRK